MVVFVDDVLSCLFDLLTFDWCLHLKMMIIITNHVAFRNVLLKYNKFSYLSWCVWLKDNVFNLSILDHIVLVSAFPLEGRFLIALIVICLLKDDFCALLPFRFRVICFSNVLYFIIWRAVVEFINVCPLEGNDDHCWIYHCVSSWRNL